MTATITLYHYTCREHLSDILVDGFLDVTESNISRTREHAGPDVVWLTTLDRVERENDADDFMGLIGSILDKTAIRITVEVPKIAVKRWREWAKGQGIDPNWAIDLAKSGTHANTWRVMTRRIPRSEWVEIYDMNDNALYWVKS